jgi:hypothetical protein
VRSFFQRRIHRCCSALVCRARCKCSERGRTEGKAPVTVPGRRAQSRGGGSCGAKAAGGADSASRVSAMSTGATGTRVRHHACRCVCRGSTMGCRTGYEITRLDHLGFGVPVTCAMMSSGIFRSAFLSIANHRFRIDRRLHGLFAAIAVPFKGEMEQ